MSRMTRFKVIVSTCVSASVFYGIGMARGHFGYIFVDEAGQATEPEVMIAVKTMADSSTRVILSGDHKQLGPIIRSNVARALGLETSYLERLMNRDGYEEVQNFGIRFFNPNPAAAQSAHCFVLVLLSSSRTSGPMKQFSSSPTRTFTEEIYKLQLRAK